MNTTFQDFANWSSAWASMGKTFQPFFETQKINSNLIEQLTQENLSLWSDNMGCYVKFMQDLNKTQRPEEYSRAWMGYMAEQSSRNVQYLQNLLEIYKHSMQEYTHSMQGKVENAFADQEMNHKHKRSSQS